jgi:amidase
MRRYRAIWAAQVAFSFMLVGPRFSDMKLLGYGCAFEQATHALRQPATTPPLPEDQFSY